MKYLGITSAFILLFTFSTYTLIAQKAATDLRCEYLQNPIGLGVKQPRLSWIIPAEPDKKNIKQTAYQIQVAPTLDDLQKSRRLIWDSGRVDSDQSIHVTYPGELTARTRYHWRVRTWDQDNQESPWSEPAYWEMGLLHAENWSADWIKPGHAEDPKIANPAPLMRKEFSLDRNIAKARLYVTSHGLYHAEINGEEVTEDLFTPGWTSFAKRLQYQTYDVTALLQRGDNAIGISLGDGWYRGKFGFSSGWNLYGEELALLAQLEVEYTNGKKEVIGSDATWKSSTGPIRMTGIYDGEVYDARMERPGWSKVGYDTGDWSTVKTTDISKEKLIEPRGVPVRKKEILEPKKVFTTPAGEMVVDMGQNMVGWVEITLDGNAGDTVSIYHAEVLDKDGNFYTENLRAAEQRMQYILNGNGPQTFAPQFTFQGFQFIKLEGLDAPPDPSSIKGVAVYSDMEPTGTFECGVPLLNQLQSNIQWGQRGNFLDVPTDCPQRDERMGWTGDAQAFAPTACYNFNTAAFYTKWLGDVAVDQKENGAIPFVVPNVLGDNAVGSTGWGDVATILPWTMYLKYGDVRILEEQFETMTGWVDFLDNLAGENHLVQDGFHFGDWLFFIHPTQWNVKPGYSDVDFLATAFFAYSTHLVVEASKVLGKSSETAKYMSLLTEIKSAFQEEFVTKSGRLSPHSQTAYTLALAFDLLKEDQQENAVRYLVKNIESRDFHLSTGFLGTPHLCRVLSDRGYTDVAYKLLLQETYPSWLYPVTRGATTIWERWDGIKPDSSFQTTEMNSFNHYAYGAIGDWMYSVTTGIQDDPEIPGYKHIYLRPHPNKELQYASASHKSLYGTIHSSWKIDGDQVTFDFVVPPNTTAVIEIPQNGINPAQGVDRYEVGSGSYKYEVAMQ